MGVLAPLACRQCVASHTKLRDPLFRVNTELFCVTKQVSTASTLIVLSEIFLWPSNHLAQSSSCRWLPLSILLSCMFIPLAKSQFHSQSGVSCFPYAACQSLWPCFCVDRKYCHPSFNSPLRRIRDLLVQRNSMLQHAGHTIYEVMRG